jgi:hypothetical protein
MKRTALHIAAIVSGPTFGMMVGVVTESYAIAAGIGMLFGFLAVWPPSPHHRPHSSEEPR